ncbi:hypothetical protein H5410_051749 [Solanum commersonii]|uniref:Uncharacterized protein n=1 Tax=Solanum commersonii TaxID=4109 RepID=A0A9J5WZD8_SOLCO|nr:hypothetical protein H5410_051749 [Solanum commersonii]
MDLSMITRKVTPRGSVLRVNPTLLANRQHREEATPRNQQHENFKLIPMIGSYILYNIGLIHTSNGEHMKALEYYFRALEAKPILTTSF